MKEEEDRSCQGSKKGTTIRKKQNSFEKGPSNTILGQKIERFMKTEIVEIENLKKEWKRDTVGDEFAREEGLSEDAVVVGEGRVVVEVELDEALEELVEQNLRL